MTGGGGLVFAGPPTSPFGFTRSARCIIFEACPVGFLEDECPEIDCISQVLAIEQERYH